MSVALAGIFLYSLTPDQLSMVSYPFDSEQRSNWSNLLAESPRSDRNGVRIGDLNAEQSSLLHQFLRSSLSQHGYHTVMSIVGADAVPAKSRDSARVESNEDNYWIAFFGEPSNAAPWAWQFGGHHLAINLTYVARRSYLSPTFIAIEPAAHDTDGATVAPLTFTPASP